MTNRSQQLPQTDDNEDGLFVVSEQRTAAVWFRYDDVANFRCLVVCSILLMISVALNVAGLLESHWASSNVQRVSQQLNNATIPAWKSLPAPSTVLTMLAFGSCSSQQFPQPYWDTVAALQPDLFLLMGDNVYGDCSDAHCSELRRAYFDMASHPSVLGGAPKVSVFATLDDHDYGQNDCHMDNPHKDIAVELFAEFFALDRASLPKKDGVYRSRIWGPLGQRLQVILLDTRYSRSPFQSTGIDSSPYTPSSDSNQQMLSDLQWRWLEQQIIDVPADLRVVVSSVQVLNNVTGFECWRHLPHERDRLLGLLSNQTVLFLSGDRHFGGLYERHFVEVTASSFTHSVPLGTFSDCSTALECDEVDSDRVGNAVRDNHFGSLEIDWDKQLVRVALRRAEQSKYFHYQSSQAGGNGESVISKTYSFLDLRGS